MRSSNIFINVGVTGHRNIAPEHQTIVQRNIKEVLCLVHEEAETLHQKYPHFFDSVGAQKEFQYRLITSLAEGADCLAAQVALSEGYSLQCPIPFRKSQYESTFEGGEVAVQHFRHLLGQADSVMYLDFEEQDSSYAYKDASRIMLAHSDIVLAIWDGTPSKYIAGTYATIKEAEQAHVPLIIINPEHPEDVVYVLDSHEQRNIAQAIKERLQHILLPQCKMPDLKIEDLGIPFPAKNEPRTTKQKIQLSALFNKVLMVGSKKIKANTASSEDTHLTATAKGLAHQQWDETKKLYSTLSSLYSNIHRNRLFLQQVLPVLALMLLIGALNTDGSLQVCLYIAQVCVLMWVIALVHIDRHSAANRLFYGYRGMAERCRIGTFLWSLGYGKVNNQHRSYMQGNNRSESTWYYRILLRQMGLPSVTLGQEYARAWLQWLRKDYLQSQFKYHFKRKENSLRLQRRLRLMALIFFFGGLSATIGRACAVTMEGSPALIQIAAALALFLPTAASFWSAHSVNSGFAMHYAASTGMCAELTAMMADVDCLLKEYETPNSARTLAIFGIERLFSLCDCIDKCCMEEVADWEDSIQKRLLKLV
ncbi:MAG: hypothetical protein IJ985_04590 [Akkermansia sp.]|nr:hypothetical protein [Akkermansia sp.]